MIELYLCEILIDSSSYSVHLPAKSWRHAKETMDKIGGRVIGSEIHTLTAIPIESFMDFCNTICDKPIKWKWNAREQLEAFLSCAWKQNPESL